MLKLDLLLDPLTSGQKAAVASYPVVVGEGDEMRLALPIAVGWLTVSQDDPPEIERFNDGTARIPTTGPRPLTWGITLEAAHGIWTTTVLEMLWSALQSATFNGTEATTRLWDYTRPTSSEDYTEFVVAITGYSPPQDAMLGETTRYINGGSLTLLEVG
jgi:hypothetical protein